ncbi:MULTISPECIES: hypothetical protein [Legionella]|uniref:Uncharacterized protein n=1 Tax=Legionella resiliens TaxID=2905958 RepID=A0ABS8X8P4_9GAMM|nr:MULTISPECIES: hypothetical protein [unclassified Legionella]MCE0724328.1 hypothetical protein [Legionella sp. 9fVS26]MCE3533480.1 hypothetical protein [Legionella sp. 8cVS16]QLZ69665.1 hypothetical protein FOLKNPGA_02460 [Legionella sp. PC1000]
MGKDAKEKKAFESASSMRTTYIEQLQKCKSAAQFETFSSRYEEKKRKNPKPANLTPHHNGVIRGLDLQIQQLTEELNNKFYPKTPIQSLPRVEETVKRDPTASLSEARVLDELSHIEEQELGAQAKVVAKKEKSTSLTQIKTAEESPKNEVGGKRTHSVTKQSVSFGIPVDDKDKPKSRHVTWNENQLRENQHQEHGDSRSIRHRTRQVSEVKDKLKTLHTKQTKYDGKAKEFHRKKDQEGEVKYRKAAKAAGNIHSQISRLVDQYIRDGDLDAFKLNSQKILGDEKNDDVKTLRAYRGWWEKFLDDLVELINSGLTRMGSSMRVHELSIFKPATTDGGHKINDLSNAISSVKATL